MIPAPLAATGILGEDEATVGSLLAWDAGGAINLAPTGVWGMVYWGPTDCSTVAATVGASILGTTGCPVVGATASVITSAPTLLPSNEEI